MVIPATDNSLIQIPLLMQPLTIFVLALVSGFLMPLFYRARPAAAQLIFLLTLISMAVIAALNLLTVINGAPAIIIETAGFSPPFSINLQFGLFEGALVLAVNCAALLTAWHFLPTLKHHAAAMLLFLILIMGINGMIMTRDLFNLFIFIEITSIATYSLIGLERSGSSLVAGFKYIMATSIASAFFLLATIFIYYQTGTLNIDDIIASQDLLTGPIGFIAPLFLLTSLLIELKPYPANGWGLDVYETTSSGVASIISVGVSTGVLFALYKVLPLMQDFLPSIVLIGSLTFLFSNFIGLKQTRVKRLLGYSSIAQIGMLTMAIAMLVQFDAEAQLPLIAGGLFINHLFAKAGLFWLAGIVNRKNLSEWSCIARRPMLLLLLGLFISSLIGLPPSPGFWAKWAMIMMMAEHAEYIWIALILLGSLLEAAYLFRWFSLARQQMPQAETTIATDTAVADTNIDTGIWTLAPVGIAAIAITLLGFGLANTVVSNAAGLFLPLFAGLLLWLVDRAGVRLKLLPMLIAVAFGGYLLTTGLEGINRLFSILLLGGGLLLSIASVYSEQASETRQRKGYFPLLAVLLLSLANLPAAQTTLEFFFSWELMTFSSYLLISLGHQQLSPLTEQQSTAQTPALRYLLFSLGSAYFLLAGFALAYSATGSLQLAELGSIGAMSSIIFSLLAIGFLIKTGAFGMHIWLPAAYAEADDDFTAILSGIVSKAGIFGLIIIAAQMGMHSGIGLEPAYVVAWLGILTATFGALMAVFQEDIKRLIAYSSMGQLGYIVTGIALMSHLGWVTALYMTVNHFLFKGILFLSIAGIVMRTNQRLMYKMGGLIKNMPFTFVFSMIAIIAMSGVPPLTGYGGKWMLFNALMEKGWYWIAALAFFSSAVAFLYMFRFLHTVFLGQRKLEHRELREAPTMLLLPQAIMVAIILFVSAYPKPLIDTLSAAVSPWFSNTLIWQGNSLQSHLGNWDAPLIMAIIAMVWMIPLLILLLISLTLKVQKVEQFNIVYAAERPRRPEETHFAYNFFAHYDRAIGYLVRPRASAFWHSSIEWSHSIGASLRIFYNGNGQTYALFVIMYFVGMFLLNGGLNL